jgi:hypothetical protein
VLRGDVTRGGEAMISSARALSKAGQSIARARAPHFRRIMSAALRRPFRGVALGRAPDGRNVKLRPPKTTLYHLDERGAANAVHEYRRQNPAAAVGLPFLSDCVGRHSAKEGFGKGAGRPARRGRL